MVNLDYKVVEIRYEITKRDFVIVMDQNFIIMVVKMGEIKGIVIVVEISKDLKQIQVDEVDFLQLADVDQEIIIQILIKDQKGEVFLL